MGLIDDSIPTFLPNRLLKTIDKRLGSDRQRSHSFKALGN